MPLPIFRTKPISTDDSVCDTGLKRCLSAFDLTLLGIGAIIGTGIFVLTGIAAANQAGPAVVLSFVISGFACAFAALAYAELAAAVGGCGSAYGYSYVAFGEIVAWIIGWILLLEYSVSVAAVARADSAATSDTRCCTAWKRPMGRPNCMRSFAYEAANWVHSPAMTCPTARTLRRGVRTREPSGCAACPRDPDPTPRGDAGRTRRSS